MNNTSVRANDAWQFTIRPLVVVPLFVLVLPASSILHLLAIKKSPTRRVRAICILFEDDVAMTSTLSTRTAAGDAHPFLLVLLLVAFDVVIVDVLASESMAEICIKRCTFSKLTQKKFIIIFFKASVSALSIVVVSRQQRSVCKVAKKSNEQLSVAKDAGSILRVKISAPASMMSKTE